MSDKSRMVFLGKIQLFYRMECWHCRLALIGIATYQTDTKQQRQIPLTQIKINYSYGTSLTFNATSIARIRKYKWMHVCLYVYINRCYSQCRFPLLVTEEALSSDIWMPMHRFINNKTVICYKPLSWLRQTWEKFNTQLRLLFRKSNISK